MPRFLALGAAALALASSLALADESPVPSSVEEADDPDDNSTDDVELPTLPPLIEFTGKKPKVKIYPGGVKDKNATWYMLEFGKVEELGADGKAVNERAIKSLASEADIVFTQTNTTVGGVEAQVTDLSLPLDKIFTKECKDGGKTGSDKTKGGKDGGSGAGSERRLAGRMPDGTSALSIRTFIFANAATIQYGNETLEVAATSFKYNVESTNWPFCAEGNKLRVNMNVKVKGDKRPKQFEDKDMEKEEEERKKTGKKGKGVKGKKFKSSAGKLDVEMDLPTLTLVDAELADSEVDLEMKGSKTDIAFTFPYFNESMVYDPTGAFAAPDTRLIELDPSETTSSSPMTGGTSSAVDTMPGDNVSTTMTPSTGGDAGTAEVKKATDGNTTDGNTTDDNTAQADFAARSSSSAVMLAVVAAVFARPPSAS